MGDLMNSPWIDGFIMEAEKHELVRKMYKTLFSRGSQPKRLMFIKPEFRQKFANELKKRLPDEFPTVKIEANKDIGLIFKSPTTRVYFNNDHPRVQYWSPLQNDWDWLHDEDEEEDINGIDGMYDDDIEQILVGIYKDYQEKQSIEQGRNVRNAQLTGALTGLPHGPESRVASMLSGIEGKNAYQQGDILKRSYGVQGPSPNRKQYSGRRKTLRRKNLRSTRKR
jgi:hypothetical protein